MNIPKAIEILEDIIHYVDPGDPRKEHDAVKLGIEALKRLKLDHINNPFHAHRLLPGETPPEDDPHDVPTP